MTRRVWWLLVGVGECFFGIVLGVIDLLVDHSYSCSSVHSRLPTFTYIMIHSIVPYCFVLPLI
ncbi:hypothetical protein EV424DRAFT_1390794 [Suillus variegatus]|nr:hypothetical protein EV424DRAFT_1390794 [Suillus variegatus]